MQHDDVAQETEQEDAAATGRHQQDQGLIDADRAGAQQRLQREQADQPAPVAGHCVDGVGNPLNRTNSSSTRQSLRSRLWLLATAI